MYIANLAARELFDTLAVVFYPAFVKEVALGAVAYGLYLLFKSLARRGVEHCQHYAFACFACEHGVVILAALDCLSVDFLDYAAFGNFIVGFGQRPLCYDLGYLQSVAVVAFVIESSE